MLETPNLLLLPRTRRQIVAWVEAVPPSLRAQLSADWLQRIDQSTEDDPWLFGYVVTLRIEQVSIGNAGFKAPPSSEGDIEIAYGIDPPYQNKGYATEAARALTEYALSVDTVRTVLAHTLPDGYASQRVLTKCGFQHIGEVIDPDDGLVWRWSRERDAI